MMAKQKIETEIDVPEGYEATGERRTPRRGDLWAAADGTVGTWDNNGCECQAFIIRRKEPLAIQACRKLADSMQPWDADYREACNIARQAIADFEKGGGK
jgi:hypothetical protein